jgi:hypothetical protein
VPSRKGASAGGRSTAPGWAQLCHSAQALAPPSRAESMGPELGNWQPGSDIDGRYPSTSDRLPLRGDEYCFVALVRYCVQTR